MSLTFSLKDFRSVATSSEFSPPRLLAPYISIDRAEYSSLADQFARSGGSVADAFSHLRSRLGPSWFANLYASQSAILSYSQTAFPAYRFLLPEVLADDWAATVDWRSYQRDHLIHQPLTAYVVYKLLTRLNVGAGESEASLLDWCADAVLGGPETLYCRDYLADMGLEEASLWFSGGPISRELWKALFLETAYLAAAFHDMGYPWRYIGKLGSRLEHVLCMVRGPGDQAEQICEVLGDRLVFVPFRNYCARTRPDRPVTWVPNRLGLIRDALMNTHGLPGAVAFLYLNDVLREYPVEQIGAIAIRRFCVEWAALAIMMHDMKDIYWGEGGLNPDNPQLRLRIERDPLSSILTLADLVEEFGRPCATFSPDQDSGASVRYQSACQSATVELARNKETLTISFEMSSSPDRANKVLFLEKENQEYFNPRDGFLDLSALGIRSVRFLVE